MSFTSADFAIFVATYLALHLLIAARHGSARLRTLLLAYASLGFYGAWYPPAVLLLLYHAVLARVLAGSLERAPRPAAIVAMVLALLPLAVFKYWDFFLSLAAAHSGYLDAVLPLGISFYTFTMVGYYADIRAARLAPRRDFIELIVLVAFWPHLAAGPILRAPTMFAAMTQPLPLNRARAELAFVLVALGLAKKLLIADHAGALVDWNLSLGVAGMGALQAWLTLAGFGAQIYGDFSGYSDMAIGCALLLGFQLPANFAYPYAAPSLAAFWRRWHVSLSSWFRDYLYVPLGGARHGRARRTANLLTVFLLSGLWHGAALHYVLWGAWHGVLVALSKLLPARVPPMPRGPGVALTLLVVTLGWALFRLDVPTAATLWSRLVVPGARQGVPYADFALIAPLAAVALDHAIQLYRVDASGHPGLAGRRWPLACAIVLLPLALVLRGRALPFMYFQF
jgi:alginate O-acetyltransferase complex protein AlgI